MPSAACARASKLTRRARLQRVVLLEAWKALESAQGDAASLAKVEAMLPRVVKKMRKVDESGMMEECASTLSPRRSRPPSRPRPPLRLQLTPRPHPLLFSSLATDYDMLFADDEENKSAASLKFLQLAAEWKKKQAIMEQQAAAAAPEPVAVQEELAEEREGAEEAEAAAAQEEGAERAEGASPSEDGARGDDE